jgi:hypothetical protein
LARVFRPFRTLIGIAFIGGAVWAAFHVQLGRLTFAEHMDRIGQTREAEDLLDGTRAAVDPVVHEASDRLLGEYIEAPTADDIAAREPALPRRAGPPRLPGHDAPP